VENFVILNIKNSQDFKKLSSSRIKFICKTLIVIADKTNEKLHFNPNEGLNAKIFCRVGYTVSKKVSKLAVKRNKTKRRLREVFRKIAHQYCQNNYDYVIIARPQIIECEFSAIKRDLEFCLKNLSKICSK